jgi:hypothetical protein
LNNLLRRRQPWDRPRRRQQLTAVAAVCSRQQFGLVYLTWSWRPAPLPLWPQLFAVC